MKYRLYISNQTDRENVCTVLVRNGYSVRIGKEKLNGKTIYFIEYWQE